MMRKLKELLDLIVSLAQAWHYLIWGLLLISSITAGLAINMTSVKVQFTLSLLEIIALVALASYPIAKFVEWLINRNPAAPFSLNGLLWKPARFNFGDPTLICPQQGCGCPVHYKPKLLVSLQPISGTIHLQQSNDYDHIYECPQHGRLNVPN